MQLLLSKGKGLCTVSNNRILNLYEADFNQYKSFIVGWMTMTALHDMKGLPSEHFSKRGSTAIDAKFDTTLMVDICRQSRLPMILGSVDAAQCYDRVLHLWVLLMLIALLKNFVLAFVMLFTLQNMRFFVRSEYGDSLVSYGGLDTVWAWMGLGQGSRGAPDCWLLISSPMFNILRREKMCAEVENPLTREKTESVGCAFVDDANMYVFSKRLDTVQKVYDEAVEHIASWARLLRVTGGCAKSDKSFWYLLHQKFVKGEWVWESTEGTEMEIEGDEGVPHVVESLPLNEEKKFLGVFDCPEGGNKTQLEKKREKVENFVHKMSNGKLPAYLGWMAYRLKLWPSVRYGLGVMTNDMEDLDTLLDKTDQKMMNILGIASTIKKGWRKLHSTFGGVGLYNLVTEQLIERLNLLLQHYKAGSSLSGKLDASLAYLQIQLGVNVCPLDLEYDRWHYLAPLSWIKMLWRTLQVTGFEIHLDYDEIRLPRKRDFVLMEKFQELSRGNQKDMLSLSRVTG